MDLETVIQSEISQKEKSKSHILNIYGESRKMVQINLFVNRNRLTDVENKYTDIKGEGGGGMKWGIGIDTYMLLILCIK